MLGHLELAVLLLLLAGVGLEDDLILCLQLCRAQHPWYITTVSMAALGTVMGTLLAPVVITPQKAVFVPNTKSCWKAAVFPRRPALSVLGRMESDIR